MYIVVGVHEKEKNASYSFRTSQLYLISNINWHRGVTVSIFVFSLLFSYLLQLKT